MTKEQIEALRAENKTLTQKLAVSEQQNQAYEELSKEASSEISSLNSQVQSLEKQANQWHSKFEEAKKKIGDLSDRIADDREEIDGLKRKIKSLKGEKPYTLLKNTRRTPDGKKFDNLYLQVGEGGKFAPLAIQLVKFNPKQKNLLLALAKPCEIRRLTIVSDLDNRGASATIVDENPAPAEPQPNAVDVNPVDLPF